MNSITTLLQYESTDWLKSKPKAHKQVNSKIGDLIRQLKCQSEESERARKLYAEIYDSINKVEEK